MKTYGEIFNRVYVTILAQHKDHGVDVANLSVAQYQLLQHFADEITRGIVSMQLESVTDEKVVEEVDYFMYKIGA